MFCQTIQRLRGNISHTPRSIKCHNRVLLSNEVDILGRWREYFIDILNPDALTRSDTQYIWGRNRPSLSHKSSYNSCQKDEGWEGWFSILGNDYIYFVADAWSISRARDWLSGGRGRHVSQLLDNGDHNIFCPPILWCSCTNFYHDPSTLKSCRYLTCTMTY